MLYLPISRSWMLSVAARRIYLLGALADIALLATLLGVTAAMIFGRVPVLPQTAASLVRIILFPEAVGIAVLFVGMSYFWLGFDRSSYAARSIWFILVYFLWPLTLPLYYFLVYRRVLSRLAAKHEH